LVYGTLRHYFTLKSAVTARLNHPLRDKDQDLMALLLVGAYQLIFMRVPDHAAINETVAAARDLKKPWARGLLNAVLRKIAADSDAFERSVELPGWLQDRLEIDYPDRFETLFQATVERAPQSLRVNTRKTTREAYESKLAAAGINAFPGSLPEHLILEAPVPARELPGFLDGLVSIQDAGAQLLATLIPDQLPEGARILDACAAPGGKLFHLTERLPGADVTGLELSKERLAHLNQEKARLGHHSVRLVQGDATGRDWTGAEAPFDLILLDAPCSGTGTLRRHPDIKLLRQPADLPAYAELQRALIGNLWGLLKPGGCLIYCTCSLLAEENDQVVDHFLNHTRKTPSIDQPLIQPIDMPFGIPTRHGWQLLPLPAAPEPPNRTVDGFYFARMTRQEKAR
jgi:16S rRNA (cytosine967-C5)-methyltransferase